MSVLSNVAGSVNTARHILHSSLHVSKKLEERTVNVKIHQAEPRNRFLLSQLEIVGLHVPCFICLEFLGRILRPYSKHLHVTSSFLASCIIFTSATCTWGVFGFIAFS